MVQSSVPAIRDEFTPAVDRQGSSSPMTIEELKRRRELIKYVVSEMRPGADYGVIPGTSDNTLYESGAEYLRQAGDVLWDYEWVERNEDIPNQNLFYKVKAFQIVGYGATGEPLIGASWEASISNRERKFWCFKSCPKVRGPHDKGCDQNHAPSMPFAEQRDNVPDRCLKRAFVRLIKNVTGTSSLFKGSYETGDEMAPARPQSADALICSDHGVPFLYHAEGRYGPFYSHTGPKHNVGERKIAEFTQAPTRGPENGREQGGEVEADPQEVTVE